MMKSAQVPAHPRELSGGCFSLSTNAEGFVLLSLTLEAAHKLPGSMARRQRHRHWVSGYPLLQPSAATPSDGPAGLSGEGARRRSPCRGHQTSARILRVIQAPRSALKRAALAPSSRALSRPLPAFPRAGSCSPSTLIRDTHQVLCSFLSNSQPASHGT